MTRFSPLSVVLVALALVAAACGQSRTVEGDATAATISGLSEETVAVERSELEDIVDAVSGSDAFMQAVFQGPLPDGFRQTLLSQIIQRETISTLVEEAGGEITAEDRAEIQASLEEQLAELLAQGAAEGEAPDTQPVLTQIEPYTDLLVERNAALTALGRSLSDGAEPETQEVACVRHILVPDLAVAEQTIQELEAGGDFAALARERSLDPGSGAEGGDLGCAPTSGYVPEFAEAVDGAEIGEIVGPVETQFGFHVIEVYDRQEQEAPSQGDELAAQAISERLGQLEVEVSPEIGQWDAEALLVVP